MKENLHPISITSALIILSGIGLLILNIVSGGQYNIALPLIFVVLAGGFFILIFYFREEWHWATYLYIPSFLMTAFGVIFTLNVVTKDWSSWAYAWILLLAAIGIGGIFASRGRSWSVALRYTAWGLAIGGFTFFGVFGVITGGAVIQIVAPLLLVAAGIALRLLKPITAKLPPEEEFAREMIPAVQPEPVNFGLSQRETEVLQLIARGLTNQQIALRLSVAESTIKTHINNIYVKLRVQSRVQAINAAHKYKLIPQ